MFTGDSLTFRRGAQFHDPETATEDNKEQYHKNDGRLSHTKIFKAVFVGHDIERFRGIAGAATGHGEDDVEGFQGVDQAEDHGRQNHRHEHGNRHIS